jgi:hypothetical protein
VQAAVTEGNTMECLAWLRANTVPDSPQDVRELVDKLSGAGVRALLLQTAHCEAPPGALLDASAEAGVDIHLWVKPVVGVRDAIRRTLPPETAQAQIDETGVALFRACMNHPHNTSAGVANIQKLIDITGSRIAGIHLDYMRNDNALLLRGWPCQCEACQDGRTRWLGRGVLTADDLADPVIMYKELQTRNASTRRFVAQVREATRAASLKLSLAARANYLNQPDILEAPVYGLGPAVYEGQDWLDWAESGLLDFICTMNYHTDPATFRQVASDHQRLLGSSPATYYCGLGISSSMGELTPAQALEHLAVASEIGAAGCCLFHVGGVTDAHLNALQREAERLS